MCLLCLRTCVHHVPGLYRRTKIAQRFIAGNLTPCSKSEFAKRTLALDSRGDRFVPLLSPISRALVILLLLVLSTKVLGYFRNVRFADEKLGVAMPASKHSDTRVSDLKVLDEGFHSSINDPFVAVLRDAETYSDLLKLDGNLPKLDADFFKSNIVIAAFLGQRNTGGYSVEITRDGSGGVHVVEKKPAKGVMVPQMITSPFKVVSVPVARTAPIMVGLEDEWERRMQTFLVTSGTFTNSGGFAGKVEKYSLEGKVSVIRAGRLATVRFLLKNAGETNEHLLFDVATGIVESGGVITINKLSAFTLVSEPNSGLRAKGRFADAEHRLSLEFNSLPSMVADGYSGAGIIEATIIVPAPKP